jgi:hypothetical protein
LRLNMPLRMRVAMFCLIAALVITGIATAPARAQAPGIFTLYRSSLVTPAMRVHIATFDSTNGGEYNQENCESARQLFQAQPGVKTRFWCEGGRYREKP